MGRDGGSPKVLRNGRPKGEKPPPRQPVGTAQLEGMLEAFAQRAPLPPGMMRQDGLFDGTSKSLLYPHLDVDEWIAMLRTLGQGSSGANASSGKRRKR